MTANQPRIITAAERAARRAGNAMPVPANPTPNTVRLRKKGCKTCQPIVVPTRATINPATP